MERHYTPIAPDRLALNRLFEVRKEFQIHRQRCPNRHKTKRRRLLALFYNHAFLQPLRPYIPSRTSNLYKRDTTIGYTKVTAMSFCTAERFHGEVSTKLEEAELGQSCLHGEGESTNAYKSAPLRWNSSPRVPRVINVEDERTKTMDRTTAARLRGILSNLFRSARDIPRLYMQSRIVFAVPTFAAVMVIFVTLMCSQIEEKPAPPSAGKDVAGMNLRLRSDSLDSLTFAEAPAWLTVTARRVLTQISGEVTLTSRKPMASTRVLGESKEVFAAAPPRARIAYLIMTSGLDELHKTKRLIEAIYDANNFYLVHLDRKSDASIRADLEDFISTWDNVRMLEPAVDVSWGGYTVTLTAIFGLSKMVQSSDDWDYFINLSASDFPLLPQAELTEVLGRYADAGVSFVAGAPLNERNRVEVMIDDQGLYREKQTTIAGRPLKIAKPRLPPSKSVFTVFKGEFWVILHRSFCEYIEASPDNVARSLQAYFSRFRISDESYFQTVLCHPLAPSFPVYSDNLRFVSWPPVSEGHYVLHPDPITTDNVDEAIQSGALYARKFDTEVSKGAYAILKENLGLADPDRLGRAVNRLAPAADVGGREKFCAIPEGYSIQEVLSRPAKVAMPMPLHKEWSPVHHEELEHLAEDTASSNVQPRETRAGKEGGK